MTSSQANKTSANDTLDSEDPIKVFNGTFSLNNTAAPNNVTAFTLDNDGLIGTLETDFIEIFTRSRTTRVASEGNVTDGVTDTYLNLTAVTGHKQAAGDTTYGPIQDPKITYTEPKKDFLQDFFGNDTVKIIIGVTLALIVVALLAFIVISKRRSGTGSSDPSQVGEWRAQSQHRESDVDGTGSIPIESQV